MTSYHVDTAPAPDDDVATVSDPGTTSAEISAFPFVFAGVVAGSADGVPAGEPAVDDVATFGPVDAAPPFRWIAFLAINPLVAAGTTITMQPFSIPQPLVASRSVEIVRSGRD